MRLNARVVLLAMATLAFTSCAVVVRTSRSDLLTLCDVVSMGASAEGREVRLAVVFQSDGLENSVLTDERCPDVAVEPLFEQGSRRDAASMGRLELMVYGGPLDAPRFRKIEIETSGTFHWRTNRRPHGTLNMEKVWVMKRLE
jgi:hypothetical protein